MRVGVLALQGDFALHSLSLEALGVEAVPVRDPQVLHDVGALILPGGESTTMAMLLESSGLKSHVADALHDGMPTFGTCAGMILLAGEIADGRDDQWSFGAIDIAVRRNGYGRQVDSFECEVDFCDDHLNTQGPMHSLFIRAPYVQRVGPDVEVLARLPQSVEATPGAFMVSPGASDPLGSPVLCRQSNVLVAAFHPELGEDLRVHELFLTSVN